MHRAWTFPPPAVRRRNRYWSMDFPPNMKHEGMTEAFRMDKQTEDHQGLLTFLSKLGLDKFFPNKLTLQSLLEINQKNISDEKAVSLKEIPWCFLRKLLKISAKCRSSIWLTNVVDDDDEIIEDNEVNPLDLITALFLCADSFLQQELALKMSMCQFSVPLLLPCGRSNQSTLMLWALRDIIKEWRPLKMAESKGFVENNIVCANIPLISFVKLKNCSLPKTQLLNHVISCGQQTQNTFVHREMEAGSTPRRIANGLVEVSWFLPGGEENKFDGPVAFANLRGDVCETLDQFKFLSDVSTATFIFLNRVEETEHKALMSLPKDVISKLFFVCNPNDVKVVMKTIEDLQLTKCNMRIKRQNIADFSKELVTSIKEVLKDKPEKMAIENMTKKAAEIGIHVDEYKCDFQKTGAFEIMQGIGVQNIGEYKKSQLPLQGQDLKTLANLEKEECKLQNTGCETALEDYIIQLHERKQAIRDKQSKYTSTEAMTKFIASLSTTEKEERYYFLKWMKLKLDALSRTKLSKLRSDFKEQCQKQNKTQISKLDQELLACSLGLEHYMREIGQIYEVSFYSSIKAPDEIRRLPQLAAEMLLDGYPLELLDGDTSNIPEGWVTDVLTALHRTVDRSRLLVLTVLGVQSSGKSTLLNTMFGVQFPVSSGRCTRGAHMQFLRITEDKKSNLNCDFILIIDTEGLKSPDLAQLEDSYEHDNQLATLVIGLSDVTIINIAMENATEMKDILQIVTHAFLRMKKLGKKPICHFVHQNVAGVAAKSNNQKDRKQLLDQLNEATLIAAGMEKHPSIKSFTDVLDYDSEKNTWYFPGLWHGTPPMAAVNTGYSVAVSEFKNNLLTLKGGGNFEASEIPDFLQWMRSLWKAVKYENFVFSFRNTLVAHAYDSLCKEYNQWEWAFRKEILSWQTEAEVEISTSENENALLESKKSEASKKIWIQKKEMREKLQNYYKKKDKHVNLIEKYKADFDNAINGLEREITHSVKIKLDNALDLKINTKRAEDIVKQGRQLIEERVMKCLGDCKDQKKLTDDQLRNEFENMWTAVTKNISGLQERNISATIHEQLRKKVFGNRNNNEDLDKDLLEMGIKPFEVRNEHFVTKSSGVFDKVTGLFKSLYYSHNAPKELQSRSDSVINSCTRFVLDTAKTNKDYNDTFTNDLLDKIDNFFKESNWGNAQFHVDLTYHICGIASREFLEMHRRFQMENSPKNRLEKYKMKYLSDFLDLYKEKDDCKRKATGFIQSCIKPAMEDYINRALGINIVETILTSNHSAEYSSRSHFQYSLQKELLQKDVSCFLKYMSNYDIYVKDWILEHIQTKMSEDKCLYNLKNDNLTIIVQKITAAIDSASSGEDGSSLPYNKESIPKLIDNMQKHLVKDILISKEDVEVALFQIKSKCRPFTESLKTSLLELKEQLQKEFSNPEDFTETLNNLPIKPQDELFKRMFGCGKQCPFCKVPCEAGGREHAIHHASVHRPQGLGRYRDLESQKLDVTLCTTDVQGNRSFRNSKTNGEFHPYKEYRTYYPEWEILSDPSTEASDYWNYVLVTYNERFAEEFNAKPADVPEAWRSITEEQALNGLKKTFYMP